MARKKRLAGRDLADLAAVYGLPAGRLSYAAFVSLLLNLPRAVARRQAIVSTGYAVGAGEEPPDGWYGHLTDDPNEAAQWEADRLLAQFARGR